MIYLATPYSHPSSEVREWRYKQAQALWWHYIIKGNFVFSPIVQAHPAAVKYKAPKGYDFWRKLDEDMILASTELWIALIPGWDKSKGMEEEIAFAKANGIPCRELAETEMILEKYNLLQFPGSFVDVTRRELESGRVLRRD